MKLSELIRNQRLAKNLTQSQVAKALGYESSMAVSLMEKGAMNVPPAKIGAICKMLNISAEAVIQGMVREFEEDLRKASGLKK